MTGAPARCAPTRERTTAGCPRRGRFARHQNLQFSKAACIDAYTRTGIGGLAVVCAIIRCHCCTARCLGRYAESLRSIDQRCVGWQSGVAVRRANRDGIAGAGNNVPIRVHPIHRYVERIACSLRGRCSRLAADGSRRGSLAWNENLQLGKRPGTVTVSIGKPIRPDETDMQHLINKVEKWIEDEVTRLGNPLRDAPAQRR